MYCFLPKLSALSSFRYDLIWLRLERSIRQVDSFLYVADCYSMLFSDTFPAWFIGSWFSSVESVLWRNLRIIANNLVNRLISLCALWLKLSNTGKKGMDMLIICIWSRQIKTFSLETSGVAYDKYIQILPIRIFLYTLLLAIGGKVSILLLLTVVTHISYISFFRLFSV